MHLLIPFASALPDAAAEVLRDLNLPQLARLLGRLAASPAPPAAGDAADAADAADEYSFSPPHERALAAAWGWPPAADGCLPFAARAAAADGIDVGGRCWGLVTPAHWHVGRDQVALADPAALRLDEAGSRTLFDAVRGLFESEGFTVAWGAPGRWYVAHDGLARLPTASLDRVVGRDVNRWVGDGTAAPAETRLLRRLQSEVQLLLYPHPVNEAREARGEATVNSFWLSGCGRFAPADEAAVRVDDRLRAPLLAQDWAGWADAWRALDAGPLADLAAGEATVALTLCGERSWQRFDATATRPLLQRLKARWSAPEPCAVLAAL